jgi:hypothetical protein
MSVPLDRLYHYIENVAQHIYNDRVIIYRFFPHGVKNIANLNNLHPDDYWLEKTLYPSIWCNDQEPLDYNFYSENLPAVDNKCVDIFKRINVDFYTPKNLNHTKNIFEKGLLLHSEKRSIDLDKYKLDDLIPVYYWNHAFLALDWFRYAKHEIFRKNTVKKTFLIYNRAWTGTREYRLKFIDLLIDQKLVEQCQTSVNAIDPDTLQHYKDYNFKNISWKPNNTLENFLEPTVAGADSSANFVTEDYKFTDIEVVLETLFDDGRLHLTEKSLRPIACGQPFIVAGTHGSLKYLHSYGFKTFEQIWDETYDQEINPECRLLAITNLMKTISQWDSDTRQIKLEQARLIAEHNRKWFFSKEFFDLIVNELKTNFELAFDEFKQCHNYKQWYDRWNKLLTYPEITSWLDTAQDPVFATRDSVTMVLAVCKSQLSRK